MNGRGGGDGGGVVKVWDGDLLENHELAGWRGRIVCDGWIERR